MYCIDQDEISLYTFGFDGEDNEILNLNGQRAAKIDTKELHEILTANFKTYKDKSGGSVSFVRNCTLMDNVLMRFLHALSDEFSGIKIESVDIKPQSTLPENFNDFRLENIFINSKDRSSGTFRASFEQPDLASKSIFFQYSFKAKMPVFLALNSMDHKHILGLLDYQSGYVEFNKYQKDYISSFPSSTLITKTKIKAGEILSTKHFIAASLVKKGDSVKAVLNEGGVSIIIEVKALENGNLGDIIKIRTRDNKILSAVVSSSKQVMIQ
ncbi:flagellar basal body P-ring formation protein FlgA [Campylobacter sp. RM12920]|uniref:Flagellar basal body P-ring formation protein FlgA n=1 Tax=Campylobacter californiensis TaxID=1032243 RepID=A0ABD4JHH4_9BACT|nr:flagellar basal body P-ring formation protein FlgA [Campylobacter sp. RM12919]MBE2988330.1 flagellar basal body P-ring formation protein FlgA [Campylobacter sp. RM12920]